MRFKAIPRGPKHRGREDTRIIGVPNAQGGFLNTRESLLAALKKKANKYGDLDAGLVIAVNYQGSHLKQDHEMETLFGEDPFGTGSRVHNGLWYDNDGPRYTRVSAVMFFREVRPWTYGQRDTRLYLNPSARSELVGALRQVTIQQCNEPKTRMIKYPRKQPYEILGVWKDWPVQSE